jgi:hypothetical protein
MLHLLMQIKKHLSFGALRKILSEHFLSIKDNRQSGKIKHTLHDCMMSGFAMMLYQDPSLLQFQNYSFKKDYKKPFRGTGRIEKTKVQNVALRTGL